MELEKIRNLSDDELVHQEKTSAEQLFRLRFQVSLGQNDGVKKLRQLRKEIAQIKTVARERELGIRGAAKDVRWPQRQRPQEGSPLNDGDDKKQHRRRRHGARRNEKVGKVVSTKMQKTIVVEVEMRKAAPQVQADHAHDQEVLCPRRAEFGAHGRCGAHPRDPSAEQAEAVVTGRDCAAFVAGPD